MKDYLKSILKNYLSKQEITIESTNNSFVFAIKKTIPFFQKNLIIKHRNSGKRISKTIKNKKIEIFSDEIKNLLKLVNSIDIDNLIKKKDNSETFDIYLKYRFLSFEYVKRCPSPLVDKTITIISEKNKAILKSYTTKKSNLSFLLTRTLFSQLVENIDYVNCLILKGRLKLFEILEFDDVEICAENKDTGEKRYFMCSYTKNQNVVSFEAKVDFKVGLNDVKSFWKMSIRIKNKDSIIAESFLEGDLLYKIGSYEKKRLLLTTDNLSIDKNKSLEIARSLYLFKNYLRLGINTKQNWLKVFNTAKNKVLFEKYSKEETLDGKKIFFESFHGKSYSNSPKYIYEKMLEMGYGEHYKFIWSYEGNLNLPGEPIIVNSSNENYYKELASSKYWVTNFTFPVIKNNENVYLQLWHGTPLKRLGYDINVKNPEISWNHLNSESKGWDYLLTANAYSSEIFKRAFKFKKTILELGYPANDIFYSKDKNLKKDLKKKLNLDQDKKIILYAPTFRDDHLDKIGENDFNLELNLKKLKNEIGNEYLLIVRLHSVISKSLDIDNELKNFVFDFSNYDDIHELFLISDILITDYSSVFFDYAHSKRPILFFMPDIKDYEDNIRGFYLDIKKDLPGPIFINEDDLIDGVKNISKINEEFKDRYEKFYNSYCYLGHGNASEELIKIVFEGKK